MLDNDTNPDPSATRTTDAPARAFVSGAAMALGRTRRPADSLSGLAAFFEREGLPALPDLFGMGWFHEARPNDTSWSLAAESAAQTLSQSGIAPENIDALIVCSAHFTGSLDSAASGVQQLMQDIGITPAFVTGVTLGRCTSFLAGLKLATDLVTGCQYRQVLVVCADRYHDDIARLQSFALFSDGAASCLVSDTAGQGCRFAIRGTSSGTDPGSFDPMGRICPVMVTRVNKEIIRKTGVTFDQMTAFLPINIFRPVVYATETQGGVPAKRLFLDNIPDRGHCFGADPLINLMDLSARNPLPENAYALLSASVPGFRVALLLQAL